MAKIHITLVGGQPVPVYNCIKQLQPEKIIYIYSDKSEQEYNILLSFFDIPHEGIALDPVQPSMIETECKKLAERFKNDEVTINISSGTKAWSYFLASAFMQYPNTQIFFVDQNSCMWNYSNKEMTKLPPIDTHTYVNLYGTVIKEATPYSEYTEDDFNSLKKIESIRKRNIRLFTSTFSSSSENHIDLTRDNGKKDIFIDGYKVGYYKWEKLGNKTYIYIDMPGTYEHIKEEFCSEHALSLLFNSSWYEYKIARILYQWGQTQSMPVDILLNCHFKFKDGDDNNEIDIILNSGIKLLFVECKTNINKITDLDKFHSVVKRTSGMGSKALFVTQKNNNKAEEKCTEYSIIYSHIGHRKEEERKGIKALYELLDNKLNSINTR